MAHYAETHLSCYEFEEAHIRAWDAGHWQTDR